MGIFKDDHEKMLKNFKTALNHIVKKGNGELSEIEKSHRLNFPGFGFAYCVYCFQNAPWKDICKGHKTKTKQEIDAYEDRAKENILSIFGEYKP